MWNSSQDQVEANHDCLCEEAPVLANAPTHAQTILEPPILLEAATCDQAPTSVEVKTLGEAPTLDKAQTSDPAEIANEAPPDKAPPSDEASTCDEASTVERPSEPLPTMAKDKRAAGNSNRFQVTNATETDEVLTVEEPGQPASLPPTQAPRYTLEQIQEIAFSGAHPPMTTDLERKLNHLGTERSREMMKISEFVFGDKNVLLKAEVESLEEEVEGIIERIVAALEKKEKEKNGEEMAEE